MSSLPTSPLVLLMVAGNMQKVGLGYWRSPIVKTQVWLTTMGFLLWRRSCHFKGGQKSRNVMLVLLAVWWSVSLVGINIGYSGLVLAIQLALATSSGWDGIWVIRITCDARRVVNSGAEFVLGEGRPLRLMKWPSRGLLRSGAESINCRWNNSSISRRTGLFVDCGVWDANWLCGGMVVCLAVQVLCP